MHHETARRHPCLREFWRAGTGVVLYLTDAPFIARDADALLGLKQVLPPGVSFVPVASRHVWRVPIEEILHLAAARGAAAPDDPENRRALAFLRRALAQLGAPDGPVDAAVEAFVARVVRSAVERDTDDAHVPDGPLIVLGRPELFAGYTLRSGEPGEIGSILQAAGYPNRFHFVSNDYESSAYYELRDRKTLRHYGVPDYWRRQTEDYGFLYASKTPDGRTVVVIGGASGLGTWGASRMLVSPERYLPVFGDLPSTGDEPIDVLVHVLRHQPLRRPREGEFVVEGEAGACVLGSSRNGAHRIESTSVEVHVDVVNKRDVRGFAFSRQGPALMRYLRTGDERLAGDFPDVLPARRDAAPSAGETVEVGLAPGLAAFVRPGSSTPTLAPAWLRARLEQVRRSVLADVRSLPAWSSIPQRLKGRWRPQPLLITGETGTGKELVAQFVAHVWSPAVAGKGAPADIVPFHAVNVSSLSRSVIESELFGHVQGAFTTALFPREGAFRAAGHQVLFLDELDLDHEVQMKFLRALDAGEALAIGSDGPPYPVLAKVVAATNLDVDKAVLEGRLRRDFISRFRFRVDLPAVGEEGRVADPLLLLFGLLYLRWPGADVVPRLAVAEEALELLLCHRYRDNVRGIVSLADRILESGRPWPADDARRLVVADLAGVLLPGGEPPPGSETGGGPTYLFVLDPADAAVFDTARHERGGQPAANRDEPPGADRPEEPAPGPEGRPPPVEKGTPTPSRREEATPRRDGRPDPAQGRRDREQNRRAARDEADRCLGILRSHSSALQAFATEVEEYRQGGSANDSTAAEKRLVERALGPAGVLRPVLRELMDAGASRDALVELVRTYRQHENAAKIFPFLRFFRSVATDGPTAKGKARPEPPLHIFALLHQRVTEIWGTPRPGADHYLCWVCGLDQPAVAKLKQRIRGRRERRGG